MQVNVTFKNIDSSGNLKERAEEKAKKIKKFMRIPIEVRFVFIKDSVNNKVEATVLGDGLNLAASFEGEDFYSGIDHVVDKLTSQVKKFKSKQKDHKGANKDQKYKEMEEEFRTEE